MSFKDLYNTYIIYYRVNEYLLLYLKCILWFTIKLNYVYYDFYLMFFSIKKLTNNFKKMWTIVHFIKDNTIVPDSWIRKKDKSCAWPLNKNL